MLKFLKSLFATPERDPLKTEDSETPADPTGAMRVSFTYPERHQFPPIELLSPACPYCGVIQDPPSQRRRRCRDCGETIYTKTYREQGKKYLLTAAQAQEIEGEERDAQWRGLNQWVINGTRDGDWHAVKFAYFQQALILFERGRDHRVLAAEFSTWDYPQGDRDYFSGHRDAIKTAEGCAN